MQVLPDIQSFSLYSPRHTNFRALPHSMACNATQLCKMLGRRLLWPRLAARRSNVAAHCAVAMGNRCPFGDNKQTRGVVHFANDNPTRQQTESAVECTGAMRSFLMDYHTKQFMGVCVRLG